MFSTLFNPVRVLVFPLFAACILSCSRSKDIPPSEITEINPTTAFEIYDSLTSAEGTVIKNMQIDRTVYTYNGDYPPVSYKIKSVYSYEYDQKNRLVKCVYNADDYRRTRTTQLEYGLDGLISKVTMNWYTPQGTPGKDMVWFFRKENGVSKITPAGTSVPFFPPVNPANDDYKNLVMIGADNKIIQMGGTENGFMSNYSSFSYDNENNIKQIIFSSVTTEGQQLHIPSLAELEYTKYVRSPFTSPSFALVHHFTQYSGFSPSSDMLDFGVNMPVKTYTHEIIREESPSSRFGYRYAKSDYDFHYDFVYRYNSKKFPVSAVKTAGYAGKQVAYVDSIHFQYQ
jgi:hypothetical protein